MSTAIRSRFFGLTAALACCFSQTVLAQDVPGQKLARRLITALPVSPRTSPALVRSAQGLPVPPGENP
jgi:hypothetical protein